MIVAENLITISLFLFVVISVVFIFLAVLLLFFFCIIPIFATGAFFASSRKETIERMISILKVKPGDKAIDLGSGDGRLVIALAKAGAQAHGYEINPILVWWSRWKIKNARLSEKAFIHSGSFWNVNCSDFDIVVLFGIKHIMGKLELKLKRELKPGTRIVSKYFTFPTWQYSNKDNDVYLYKA